VIRRITNKPWFGPKKYIGWGWRVTSWQGAVVLVVFIVSILMIVTYARSTLYGTFGAFLLTLVFIFVALLTGDPPGDTNFQSKL
jgi:amino acid transporter